MKSYASVDEKDIKCTSLEVELVDLETSKKMNFADKETVMVDFPTELIEICVGKIKDGDIIVVEHNEDDIIGFYGKDEEEKQRRIEVLNSIMAKN